MNCDEIQFTSFNYDDETTVALSCCSSLSVGNALEDIKVYNVTEDIVYSGIPQVGYLYAVLHIQA